VRKHRPFCFAEGRGHSFVTTRVGFPIAISTQSVGIGKNGGDFLRLSLDVMGVGLEEYKD
jgi:hypothetical protein